MDNKSKECPVLFTQKLVFSKSFGEHLLTEGKVSGFKVSWCSSTLDCFLNFLLSYSSSEFLVETADTTYRQATFSREVFGAAKLKKYCFMGMPCFFFMP